MQLEVLVEGKSEQLLLERVLQKLIPSKIEHHVRVFNGKQDLLRQLPRRLRGYRKYPVPLVIVIVLDSDSADCLSRKRQLEEIARQEGFVTKSFAQGACFQVITRVAVVELESWLFGDMAALACAYPRLPRNLANKKAFRDPDCITRPSDRLKGLLARHGYEEDSTGKLIRTEKIASFIEPLRNTSRSFQAFCSGIRAAVEQLTPAHTPVLAAPQADCASRGTP